MRALPELKQKHSRNLVAIDMLTKDVIFINVKSKIILFMKQAYLMMFFGGFAGVNYVRQ